jgi:hypothetical protein
MSNDRPILSPLPEPERWDRILPLLRAAISAIPFVGGSITEVWSGYFSSPLAKRREDWLRRLAKIVLDLNDNPPHLRPEELIRDERFVSAVLAATNLAIRTHHEVKLVALQNSVKSVFTNPDITEDQQAIFTRYIDELTPWHFRVLMLFHDPNLHLRNRGISEPWLVQIEGHRGWWSTNKETNILLNLGVPELESEFQFKSQLVQDLGVRQLICVSAVNQKLPDAGSYTMTTGGRFIRFCGLADIRRDA